MLVAVRHQKRSHILTGAAVERQQGKSNKIAQKPLALLGVWSVTVGAFSASFGH
jgi:hypothetical protein